MKGYVLTARGRVIVGVLVLLVMTGLFLGVNALLSPEKPGGVTPNGTTPDSATPDGSLLPDVSAPSGTQTDNPTKPSNPADTDPPANETPGEETPGETTTPGQTPGNEAPGETNTPDNGETASELHQNADPDKWYLSTARAMFAFNSDTFIDKEQVKSDLQTLLPDLKKLPGYVIVVQGSRDADEDAQNLPYRRAEAVAGLLKDLGVSDALIRLNTVETFGGMQTYRYADISFLEVGGK